MTRPLCVLVLFCSLSVAQTKPARSTESPAKSPQTAPKNQTSEKPAEKPASSNPPAAVSADDTVVTIPGVCAAGVTADACVTKLTKSEFERLVTATGAGAQADSRRIATVYAQILAMANQAQKMGVDKDPAVQVQLHLQSLSLLAQAAQRKIFESSKPTSQEVESYYTENSAKYEEIDLQRIVVLKSSGGGTTPEEQKAVADKIRARAAAGEDPDKLQVEAYKEAKSAGTPPSTSLGWKRRGGMDPRHEPQIVNLHASEVSPVMEDGQAFYIYKVRSKRLVPMASVEKEIETSLQTERAQKALRQILEASKPSLNDAYFGASEPAKAAPPVSPK